MLDSSEASAPSSIPPRAGLVSRYELPRGTATDSTSKVLQLVAFHVRGNGNRTSNSAFKATWQQPWMATEVAIVSLTKLDGNGQGWNAPTIAFSAP
jgi:hypothetical protein